MELIKKLNWRYATKQFDTNKKISEEDLNLLMEAIRLAPSSYGLQLYKILIIEDEEIREKLKAASWNQKQITNSSAIVVFCNYKNVTGDHIEEYLKLKAELEKKNIDELKGYGTFIKKKVDAMTDTERDNWTKRQTYIALGFLLAACADLKIDACPMEGFERDKYNEILQLSQQNLSAAVIAAIGYRSQSDETQFLPKVRKPIEGLFEIKNNVKLKAVI